MGRRDLRRKVRDLPAAPGVYLMKDGRGRVLYVGKAKSLRERVTHYFSRGRLDPKTALWVRQVREIETLPTRSEVDALLLEARLIKDVRPRYNQELKDGKTFPLLEVTVAEPFPRVAVTREPTARAAVYGPFTDAGHLRQAVQILQGIFRFRTCDLRIDPGDPRLKHQRPCLLYWIRRCSAPCAGLVSVEAYRQDLLGLRRVVEGDRSSLERELAGRMDEAAGRLQFEQAALWRDQLAALRALESRGRSSDRPEPLPLPLKPSEAVGDLERALDLPHPPRRVEGIDIATLAGEDSVGALVTFADGIPFKEGYRRFRIRRARGVDDCRMIREVVERRYRRLVREAALLPDLLLVDGGKGQLAAACEALAPLGLARLPVVALAKREEALYRRGLPKPLVLDRHSLALRFLQHVRDEAHRFAQGYHHLLRGKRVRPRCSA